MSDTSAVKQMIRRALARLALFATALFAPAPETIADETQWARERGKMIDLIRAYARADKDRLGTNGIAKAILDAMAETKRHLFVPKRVRGLAYADRPLSIGHGQTISQPLVVALMTQLARVRPDHTVLEIGTGSGYQAAILARLARKVCTIEIVRPLGELAEKILKDLGYDNVQVRIGDGYLGWPECGPFDAIVVTAALGHVPPALLEQLKVGGRLVMPVGPPGGSQQLTVVEKGADGETRTETFGLVAFVPFTRSRD